MLLIYHHFVSCLLLTNNKHAFTVSVLLLHIIIFYLHIYRRTISDILDGDDVCSWQYAKEDLKHTMSRMAASSAWGCGKCVLSPLH